jgi:hypothetical protein
MNGVTGRLAELGLESWRERRWIAVPELEQRIPQAAGRLR